MKPDETKTPDPLDALLRDENHYVADDGFTARVVTALPRRRSRAWLRPAILGFAMLLGTGIALAFVPAPIATLSNAAEGLRHLNFKAALPLLPLAAALVPIFWSGFEMLREEG
ncbi:MAG: hypothetical protein RLY20_1326 [Verrucomicrobiota bacterium]|jgi:hypothetical protein